MSEITPLKPDKAYLDNQLIRKTSSGINCHRVGKIVKFNKADLTCDVKLLELMNKPLGSSGKFAIIPQLPLIIEGTDTSHLTWGNIVGSECLVHFNDRDIDNWFVTGEEYLPNTTRLHDFSDGFVTLRPYNKLKVFQYDEQAVVLENTDSKIRITENTIQITNKNLNFLIQGNTLTITGNVVVNGDITASGTITGQTDVIAGTISGKNHVHSGVQSGNSNTQKPVG